MFGASLMSCYGNRLDFINKLTRVQYLAVIGARCDVEDGVSGVRRGSRIISWSAIADLELFQKYSNYWHYHPKIPKGFG